MTQRPVVQTLVLTIFAMIAAALPVFALAQNGSLTIEQRLERVEGELAIRRVLVEYSATQDARDYVGYTELFATEGEWVNGNTVYKGREAIYEMLTGLYGETPAGYVNSESYHISSNPQIDMNGDRATVKSRHLLIMRGPNGEPTPMLGGRYEDEFIREHGEWKILRRQDFPVMPTGQEWMQFIRARQAQQ
jgi:uncharacterized protein (TIGR02246 family)